MKTILVVEDDPGISQLLAAFLAREGFAVEVAVTGGAMDAVLERFVPDLVVLDLMLPGEDGLSICRRLQDRSRFPILMLTAKNEDVDRIVGLELGAADYLGKPFSPQELLARIRAILRRIDGLSPVAAQIAFGSFVMEPESRCLRTTAGAAVPVTAAEFDLLRSFIEHPRRVLSRQQLLAWGHGRSSGPEGRAIDVTVSHLRRKLSALDPASRGMIETVRGDGYIFTAEVRKVAP